MRNHCAFFQFRKMKLFFTFHIKINGVQSIYKYQVTKKGCEFLIQKSTGKKGYLLANKINTLFPNEVDHIIIINLIFDISVRFYRFIGCVFTEGIGATAHRGNTALGIVSICGGRLAQVLACRINSHVVGQLGCADAYIVACVITVTYFHRVVNRRNNCAYCAPNLPGKGCCAV